MVRSLHTNIVTVTDFAVSIAALLDSSARQVASIHIFLSLLPQFMLDLTPLLDFVSKAFKSQFINSNKM